MVHHGESPSRKTNYIRSKGKTQRNHWKPFGRHFKSGLADGMPFTEKGAEPEQRNREPVGQTVQKNYEE